MHNFLEEIKNRILVHDGSIGYMLQKRGLGTDECSEAWNINRQKDIIDVYRQYKEAGSDVLQTNTFPGNRVHLEKYSLDDKVYEINYCGAKLAREVAGNEKYVSGSIGPTGILYEPSGELTFDRAYDIYREQVKALADGGVDIINFETFTDVAELRAALLAAKDAVDLPVICSLAFEANGRTLMGTDPGTAVAILRSLGADMVGTNCSFGAEHMIGIVKQLYEAGGGFLSVKPNAGLPEMVDGKVIYRETAERFSSASAEFVKYGARLIGGCCGSTPEFIQAVKKKVSSLEPVRTLKRECNIITSGMKRVSLASLNIAKIGKLDAGKDEELLGELKNENFNYVEERALDISTEGYDAVYINAGASGLGNGLLEKFVNEVQGYVREPLIIGCSNPVELEKALRKYRGVAGVAAVQASDAVKDALKKITEKYGSVIVDMPQKFYTDD